MEKTIAPWIVANRAGLANTLSEVERRKIIEEVIQNALDTDAKNIKVDLQKPIRGYSVLTVEDDDPNGFSDMSLAYEMFADTDKRSDPTKAGRFTIGEKRVLALSKSAAIESTKGTVIFEMVNGKESRTVSRRRRETGTKATFIVKMTEEQYENAVNGVKMIVPHEGVSLSFNLDQIPHRQAFRSFEAELATEKANENREMIRVLRKTEVRLYEPNPGEKPHLYELGIPVVELECDWHIDVRQRIPLNCDRDNVTPAYKQKILALVLNSAYDELPEESAKSGWVKDARSSDLITKEAFTSTNIQIWGEKAVVPDPNDPESSNCAVSQGYSVVRGGTKGEYENNRRYGVALSSSHLFPSPKPYSDDPNAPVAKAIPRSEWTEGMALIHEYTVALAKELLKDDLEVRFVCCPHNGFGACFGKDAGIAGPRMDYNIGRLGRAWFDSGMTERVDSLIIHEFGHYFSPNHLSEDFYDGLCKLAAAFKRLALEKPEFFEKFAARV